MTAYTNLIEKESMYQAPKQLAPQGNILLIENDLFLSNSLKSFLSRKGFEVEQTRHQADLNEVITSAQADMVLLDIGFVSLEQLSIIKEIRETFTGLLIVLTSRDSEAEQVKAFNLGADDYLVKPISINILTARITSLFRRQQDRVDYNEASDISLAEILLQPKSQKCFVSGKAVKLTGFEFNLLKLLMQHEGRILTRDAIYTQLLGRAYNGVERTVDVRMSQLREKLALEGLKQVQIETIWGQGYMLTKLN
ncbi:response regulator transcription factor [Litorilituus sediminis]|uniref:Response regulator transcription factor n=1 Tax=Litorilituus sediminis TaxID=718192 RepID=A0A4P6P2V6_9GAMM|nr:response regulator transcription factor [Litorilituus sediminis]QBG35514.1 response regulator transcription factor [Litorilituus sediminis]